MEQIHTHTDKHTHCSVYNVITYKQKKTSGNPQSEQTVQGFVDVRQWIEFGAHKLGSEFWLKF